MINRPDNIGAFKFAVLASLRAAQLRRGCAPRVHDDHCVAVTAQMEIAGDVIALHDDGASAMADAAMLGSSAHDDAGLGTPRRAATAVRPSPL